MIFSLLSLSCFPHALFSHAAYTYFPPFPSHCNPGTSSTCEFLPRAILENFYLLHIKTCPRFHTLFFLFQILPFTQSNTRTQHYILPHTYFQVLAPTYNQDSALRSCFQDSSPITPPLNANVPCRNRAAGIEHDDSDSHCYHGFH